ncbi:filament polymerization regulator ParJ [soil metagenome]
MAGFEGWNDAGDAASGAARWLADRYGAELVATIEAEEFFDFTTTRPIVDRDDDGNRRITWPDTELWAATTDTGADLVVLVGHEPHLRWRSYCRAVVDAATELDCSMVLTLGALLSDVPHTRPTAVTGSVDDPELTERLDLARSSYQGPTGIVGVLHAALSQSEHPSASLWAAVPTYVSGAPSPKATLALVERSLAVLGLSLPTTDLQIASAAYERQINELVAGDEDTAAYVAGLEDAIDEGTVDDDEDDVDLGPLGAGDSEALVEEVERFLRGD